MKKKRFSKIYALILTLICIVSMSGVASAFATTGFSYTCDYPNESYRTPGKAKKDATLGYVYYGGGGGTFIKVEMWGSDGTSANYKNFTSPHVENNVSGVTYYNVKKGEGKLLQNTMYSYYGHLCYASLLISTYATGTVTGMWSPMTD